MKNYVLDFSTKNPSFIETHEELKAVGIKNNAFFLKLYDESLKGIDPYDSAIDDQCKVRIINECVINPWYYLREVCRAPEFDGTGVPFILHKANLASIWCILNSIDNYLTTPVQNFKTHSIIGILGWGFNFGLIDASFLFFHRSPEDVQNNIRIFDLQRNLLPGYMKARFGYSATEYSREISNKYNNNKIDVKSCPKSVEKADVMGRGRTQEIQFFDDVEDTQFIKDIQCSSGPAYYTARRAARRRGSIACRIYSSIPGNTKNECCYDARSIIDNAAKWLETMYDYTIQECEYYIRRNSANNIVYIEYDYKSLRRTDEWLETMKRMLMDDQDKIDRCLYLKRK